jgi:hypothetical protein
VILGREPLLSHHRPYRWTVAPPIIYRGSAGELKSRSPTGALPPRSGPQSRAPTGPRTTPGPSPTSQSPTAGAAGQRLVLTHNAEADALGFEQPGGFRDRRGSGHLLPPLGPDPLRPGRRGSCRRHHALHLFRTNGGISPWRRPSYGGLFTRSIKTSRSAGDRPATSLRT